MMCPRAEGACKVPHGVTCDVFPGKGTARLGLVFAGQFQLVLLHANPQTSAHSCIFAEQHPQIGSLPARQTPPDWK